MCRPSSNWLLTLALLYTGLNALKPLQIDDAAYSYYAAQIARHPGDPYGFNVFWYQEPEPANLVLAPPVLPYWWSLAIRIFGDRPILWKIWLFPFALVLVCALHSLFHRFAPAWAALLTGMTVLSPAFLPSLNLMLDVPALALALASIAIFLDAWDRDSTARALLAGAVAGIAAETKYTAFLAPAAMLLYGAIPLVLDRRRRWRTRLGKLLRLGGAALAPAVGIFAAWEAWIAHRYGQSHFVLALGDREQSLIRNVFLALPLLSLLGGAAPGLGLLGLIALGKRTWQLVAFTVLMAMTFGLVALFGRTYRVEVTPSAAFPIPGGPWRTVFSVESLAFGLLGSIIVATWGGVALRLVRPAPGDWRIGRSASFLVAWLGLEIAGYFALTPFAATRRILGIVVVGTILAARLVSRGAKQQGRTQRFAWMRVAAGVTVTLGLLYWAVDCREAWAQEWAAEEAARYVRREDDRARIWFVGHWGFQFYGERAGMRPVIPNGAGERWRRGDWLVVPSEHVVQQPLALDPARLDAVATIELDDWIPFRTVACFYGTVTGAPLERRHGPRITVTVYRVTADTIPRYK